MELLEREAATSEPTAPCAWVTLAATSAAPRTARMLVRRACAERSLSQRLVDNAALVTGEIVTDDIRATRRPVDLRVEVGESGVVVRVRDRRRSTEVPPTRRWHALASRLATSWGHVREASGLETWALLRLEEA